MHVANFRADVVFAPQEVQADGAAGSEIDLGCCSGDFGIGKESAASEFDMWTDAGALGRQPCEGGKFTRSEATGIDLAIKGLAEATPDDQDLVERGMAIFDGLYTVLKGKT